jgi:hypothetical protein
MLRISQQRVWFYPRFSLRSAVLAVLVLTLSVVVIHADDDPLVGTVELEKRLQTRFNLTTKELKAIRPALRSDNQNVVRLYWNASDEQRSNYMSLWERIRQGRRDFERTLGPDLSLRQKNALKVGHTEFESRILYFWLEDYLVFLGEALALDNVQSNLVRIVFENEQDRRHQCLQSGNLSDKEWDQLSVNRDAELNRILDTDQLRIYRSFTQSAGEMVASNRTGEGSVLQVRYPKRPVINGHQLQPDVF